MKHVSIDANGRVPVESRADGPTQKESGYFVSEKEWVRVAADLPMARLVAIWNALEGVAPVARFTSRAKAAKRIWNAMRSLEPASPRPVAEQPCEDSRQSVMPEATQTSGSPHKSKTTQIIALLRLDGGARIEQLARVTGWQKHSLRGFLSGTVRKKMRLTVVSSRDETGARVYRIND